MSRAAEIARLLADRIDQLVRDLLPGGIREGKQWRAGSVAGGAGASLAVELAGPKRGVWHDFATGQAGDALDLVKACLDVSTAEAISWGQRWLGIAPGEARTPRRPASVPHVRDDKPPTWPKVWSDAQPIVGTLATAYLAARGLTFADLYGDVLRFAPRRARLKPGTTDELERLPALVVLLSDLHTGEPCGLHSIFLRPDGADRLRDKKGKLSAGRVAGAAVMLSAFEDVTYGLTIAEGVETAIGVLMDDQAPCWACCGTAGVAAFPVLPVMIQTLTIAADTGAAGQTAAREVAARWRKAGRDVVIITPSHDDWAASRRIASQ